MFVFNIDDPEKLLGPFGKATHAHADAGAGRGNYLHRASVGGFIESL